ncbi:MAG TPA: hypothetical protein VMP68_06165 [Candidatus Eisenbacteria bacterium]|nr:hypothetical protein [Candidatus Eisenbacteria bacterium]
MEPVQDRHSNVKKYKIGFQFSNSLDRFDAVTDLTDDLTLRPTRKYFAQLDTPGGNVVSNENGCSG